MDIELSADQKKQVKKIVAEHRAPLAKAKKSGDAEAKKAAMKEFRKALLDVLTAEQKAELREKQKQRKEKQPA